jgi:hypothetical protein
MIGCLSNKNESATVDFLNFFETGHGQLDLAMAGLI